MAPIRPTFKSVQDLPPKGGFPKINITRNARNRGPSGLVIWSTILCMSVFGFYKISIRNKDNRSDLKEQREARMAVLPFLQAEVDRNYSIELKENYAKEAEIMKEVPGWEVAQSPYSKRWNYPIKKF